MTYLCCVTKTGIGIACSELGAGGDVDSRILAGCYIPVVVAESGVAGG